MKIKELKELSLMNFANDNIITIQEFFYGSIEGYVEKIGYQIIFFKEKQNPSYTSAIYLDFIDDNILLKVIANQILIKLEFPIRIGDNKKALNQFKPLYTDKILDKFYYFIDESFFFSISFDESDIVCSVEIISNTKIIQERIENLNYL